MAQSEDIIDRIVAEVMAHLRAADSAPAPAAQTTAAQTNAAAASPATVEIADPVITAALLEERGIKAGPIVLSPKAVLTPSAVEFLANRRIGWKRGTSSADSSPAGKWLAIVTRSTPPVTAALDGVVNGPKSVWSRELLGCHREACERAVAALCRGEVDGALVLTGKPEAVACRANRNANVRAASITTVARIKTLKPELAPNLFAIDPTGRTEFELRSCLCEIGSGPKPCAGPDWKE
jgi:hypothetical protein